MYHAGVAEEHFDITQFIADLAGKPADFHRQLLAKELGRVRGMTVRDAGRRFKQQMYVSRMERLMRYLNGEDVTQELTPSERSAYGLLGRGWAAAKPSVAPIAEPAAAPVVAKPAPPQPARAPEPEPEPVEPTGAERRTSRRIQMKTKIRVRYSKALEIVEPINVSKGGISFESQRSYALHEIIFVTMHYQPETDQMETRSIIVRAAPKDDVTSYGVKFLGPA